MILNHIAVIVSSENSVDFYKDLGFREISRTDRGKDLLIWMEGNGCKLELFLDRNHPQRVSEPEAFGLRHIAFDVENLEKERERLIKYNPEPIREEHRIFFVKDPDGQPVEFREV